MVRKNIANYITGLRIISCIVMLFFEINSLSFMILYLIAAMSDVLDGYIARKMEI